MLLFHPVHLSGLPDASLKPTAACWLDSSSQLLLSSNKAIFVIDACAGDCSFICDLPFNAVAFLQTSSNLFEVLLSNATVLTLSLDSKSIDPSFPCRPSSKPCSSGLFLPNSCAVLTAPQAGKVILRQADLDMTIKLHSRSLAKLTTFSDLLISSSNNGTLRFWEFSSLRSSSPSPLFSYRSRLFGLSRSASLTCLSSMPVSRPCKDLGFKGIVVAGFSDGSLLFLSVKTEEKNNFSELSVVELAKVPLKSAISFVSITTNPYSQSFLIWVFSIYEPCHVFSLDLSTELIQSSNLISWKTINIDPVMSLDLTVEPIFSQSGPFFFLPTSSFLFSYDFLGSFSRVDVPFLNNPGSCLQITVDKNLVGIFSGSVSKFLMDMNGTVDLFYPNVQYFNQNFGIIHDVIVSPSNQIVSIYEPFPQSLSVSILTPDGVVKELNCGLIDAVFDCSTDLYFILQSDTVTCFEYFPDKDPIIRYNISMPGVTDLKKSSVNQFLLTSFDQFLPNTFLTVIVDDNNQSVTLLAVDTCAGKCLMLDLPFNDHVTSKPRLFWRTFELDSLYSKGIAALVIGTVVFVIKFTLEEIKLLTFVDLVKQSPLIFWSGPLLFAQVFNQLILIDFEFSSNLEPKILEICKVPGTLLAVLPDRIISLENFNFSMNSVVKNNVIHSPISFLEHYLRFYSNFDSSILILENLCSSIPGLADVSLETSLDLAQKGFYSVALVICRSWLHSTNLAQHDYVVITRILTLSGRFQEVLSFLYDNESFLTDQSKIDCYKIVAFAALKRNLFKTYCFSLGKLDEYFGIISLLISNNCSELLRIGQNFLSKFQDDVIKQTCFDLNILAENFKPCKSFNNLIEILEPDTEFSNLPSFSSLKCFYNNLPLRAISKHPITLAFSTTSPFIIRTDSEGKSYDGEGFTIENNDENEERNEEEVSEDDDVIIEPRIKIVINDTPIESDFEENNSIADYNLSDDDVFDIHVAPRVRKSATPLATPSRLSRSESVKDGELAPRVQPPPQIQTPSQFAPSLSLLEKGQFKAALESLSNAFSTCSMSTELVSFTHYLTVLKILSNLSPKNSNFIHQTLLTVIPPLQSRHRSVFMSIAARTVAKSSPTVASMLADQAIKLARQSINQVPLIEGMKALMLQLVTTSLSQTERLFCCPYCNCCLEFDSESRVYCQNCDSIVLICSGSLEMLLLKHGKCCNSCGAVYKNPPEKCVVCSK
ncbi:hypothetical protein RCL1_007772 [Eukaryota sp. TZLM3-RCL]